jgi:hypothetical protein
LGDLSQPALGLVEVQVFRNRLEEEAMVSRRLRTTVWHVHTVIRIERIGPRKWISRSKPPS